MERVLENVFVAIDAVEDHLVNNKIAVLEHVGGSDGQRTIRRVGCVKKD